MLKFCSNCGVPANATAFPYYCTPCGHTHYKNPIPVVVGLVRCYTQVASTAQYGILLVRRKASQKWALPGGFVDINDLDWQAALSREVKEETGHILSPIWALQGIETSSNRNILIFASGVEAVPFLGETPPENDEVDALRLAYTPEELAFPSHTTMLRDYLSM